MTKSIAEIQKVYRQRLKDKNNDLYRLLRKLGERTGMSRNKLAKVTMKCIATKPNSRSRVFAKQRKTVVDFLEKDDNSGNMPGKADN